MKQLKVFIAVALIFLYPFYGNAQNNFNSKRDLFEGAVMTGWLFAGKTSTAKIINAPVYSLSLAYMKNENTMYELNVNSLFSQSRFRNHTNTGDTTTRYSQTYVTFGIVRNFQTGIPQFVPYLSSLIGILNQNVHVSNIAPNTQLAAGLLGGIKYFIKDNIGIKIQARIQAPLNGIGFGVGFGFGGPAIGLNSYSNNIQFDLSGGLCFRF